MKQQKVTYRNMKPLFLPTETTINKIFLIKFYFNLLECLIVIRIFELYVFILIYNIDIKLY